MKNLLIILLFVVLTGCSRPPATHQSGNRNPTLQIDRVESDYMLVVGDEQFSHWFSNYAQPMNSYSAEFYINQNRNYVDSWNELYSISRGLKPFNTPISYDPGLGYSDDFNYRLYWFFRYIEQKYGASYGFSSNTTL